MCLLSRIFDDDEDGKIYAADMVEVLTSFGEKFTKSEARKLVQNEDNTGEGLINYEGDFISIINYCNDILYICCFLDLCTKLIPTDVTEKKTEKDTKNQK